PTRVATASTSARFEPGACPRTRTNRATTVAWIPATATTGIRPARVSRLPRAARRASDRGTAAQSARTDPPDSGASTAPTKCGSDDTAMSAFDGHESPHALHGD